jgi:hypothetical protein
LRAGQDATQLAGVRDGDATSLHGNDDPLSLTTPFHMNRQAPVDPRFGPFLAHWGQGTGQNQ